MLHLLDFFLGPVMPNSFGASDMTANARQQPLILCTATILIFLSLVSYF